MSTDPNTLLIDGNDIRTYYTGLMIVGDMNLRAPGDRKGSDEDIPGRSGELPVAGLKYAAYDFQITARFRGANRGDMGKNFDTFAHDLRGAAFDGLLTLTRVLANTTDSGTVSASCPGRFKTGLSLATLNPASGMCTLMFRNLQGFWKRLSDNATLVP